MPPERHDLPTLLAIAAVTYLGAKLAHELLGHGGACWLVGGRPVAFSTAWFDGDMSGLAPWTHRARAAAGTLVNLIVGAGAFVWLRRRPPRQASHRYALWLTAAVHLFMGTGYLYTSPIFGFGDWDKVARGLPSEWTWRVGIAVAGLALALWSLRALLRELEAFVPAGEQRERIRAAHGLTLLPYLLVGGVFMTATSALNFLGLKYAFTSALATLGGTSFLAWMHTLLPPRDETPQTHIVARHRAWCLAGCIAALLTALVFAPGVRL